MKHPAEELVHVALLYIVIFVVLTRIQKQTKKNCHLLLCISTPFVVVSSLASSVGWWGRWGASPATSPKYRLMVATHSTHGQDNNLQLLPITHSGNIYFS